MIFSDINLNLSFSKFFDKGILQDANRLKQAVLEACDLFLANSVHEV